jgi:hypothetical protein
MYNHLKLTLFSFFISTLAFSQATADSSLFDFWVGKWEVTWNNPNGTTGKAVNNIVKILDGKVIQENFVDPSPGGLKGTSISVFNSQTKVWHQAWADNQGGYYDLEGGTENGIKYFRTKMREINGQKSFQRMKFYNITPNSFTWDWESTSDGGQTWTLQWRLNYKKS